MKMGKNNDGKLLNKDKFEAKIKLKLFRLGQMKCPATKFTNILWAQIQFFADCLPEFASICQILCVICCTLCYVLEYQIFSSQIHAYTYLDGVSTGEKHTDR